MPLPYRTVAEGIVWSPGEPGVFAATDGVVVAVLQEPNTTVGEGRPLLQMEDALIDAKVRVLEATVKELRLRRDAVYATDPVQTRLLEEQISRNDSELAIKPPAAILSDRAQPCSWPLHLATAGRSDRKFRAQRRAGRLRGGARASGRVGHRC